MEAGMFNSQGCIVDVSREEFQEIINRTWGESETDEAELIETSGYCDFRGRYVTSAMTLSIFRAKDVPYVGSAMVHTRGYDTIGGPTAWFAFTTIIGLASQFYPYMVSPKQSGRYNTALKKFANEEDYAHVTFMDLLKIGNFDPVMASRLITAFISVTGKNPNPRKILEALSVFSDALDCLRFSRDREIRNPRSFVDAFNRFAAGVGEFCYKDLSAEKRTDYCLIDPTEHFGICSKIIGCAHGDGFASFCDEANLTWPFSAEDVRASYGR
jgi:hypothetical protein